MPSGRFAPSPSGRLHLGNLRTALLAWLFARRDDSPFLLRFEDLDVATVKPEHYETQMADLAALGLEWDGKPIRQSDRLGIYNDAIAQLDHAGLTYECFCSRREIREATRAPNGPWSHGHYPGTCRQLTDEEREIKRSQGRPPALRLKGSTEPIEFTDVLRGPKRGDVDDAVIRRNDGTPAYNLVVMIDDVAQDIELVVRADDLLDSTPRQLRVAQVLDFRPPSYAHVPLVLAPSGDRLAKRDGAVTLPDREAMGETPGDVLSYLAHSLGLAEDREPVRAVDLLARFDPGKLPDEPLVLRADQLTVD